MDMRQVPKIITLFLPELSRQTRSEALVAREFSRWRGVRERFGAVCLSARFETLSVLRSGRCPGRAGTDTFSRVPEPAEVSFEKDDHRNSLWDLTPGAAELERDHAAGGDRSVLLRQQAPGTGAAMRQGGIVGVYKKALR